MAWCWAFSSLPTCPTIILPTVSNFFILIIRLSYTLGFMTFIWMSLVFIAVWKSKIGNPQTTFND